MADPIGGGCNDAHRDQYAVALVVALDDGRFYKCARHASPA
ncbi:MAG TPA: hypothetical protein VFV05_06280 [Methylomirabilota bacterium]|nr:hypothetical protein [Methylomirabilota bacterium]